MSGVAGVRLSNWSAGTVPHTSPVEGSTSTNLLRINSVRTIPNKPLPAAVGTSACLRRATAPKSAPRSPRWRRLTSRRTSSGQHSPPASTPGYWPSARRTERRNHGTPAHRGHNQRLPTRRKPHKFSLTSARIFVMLSMHGLTSRYYPRWNRPICHRRRRRPASRKAKPALKYT
jgi:hypothetical protein